MLLFLGIAVLLLKKEWKNSAKFTFGDMKYEL